MNCENDSSIASTEAYAKDKSHVLEALGNAAYNIRRKLGESLATIQKYDTLLVQASTSSLTCCRATVWELVTHPAATGRASVRAVRQRCGSLQLVPGERAAVDCAFYRLEEHDREHLAIRESLNPDVGQ